MAWMIREDQLDPEQKDFVNNESKKSGNIWVKGFAGSGKSVLLVHSLKDILKKEPNAKAVVVLYTLSLIDMFKTGMKEIGLSETIPVMTYYEFVDKDTSSYDYVLCDEVQDLPAKVLYAMKNRAKKIIVAGDSNQSIFSTDPKWQEPTVNPAQIGDIINARAFSLNMIHRLTRSIISAVQKILPNMNIFGAARDTTKVDVNIRLCEANSEQEEIEYVFKESQKGTSVGESSVILLPTHKAIERFIELLYKVNNKNLVSIPKDRWNKPDYNSLNTQLTNSNIKAQFVGSGYGSLKNAESNKHTIIMTYHSAKGLDFDNVFLPFLNNSLYITPNNEETLFMVAITRSRKNLYLSYFGYTHNLVDKFKSGCTEILINQLNNNTNNTSQSDDFDF
jgi:superfamily I DNA/RNA helicase